MAKRPYRRLPSYGWAIAAASAVGATGLFIAAYAQRHAPKKMPAQPTEPAAPHYDARRRIAIGTASEPPARSYWEANRLNLLEMWKKCLKEACPKNIPEAESAAWQAYLDATPTLTGYLPQVLDRAEPSNSKEARAIFATEASSLFTDFLKLLGETS